MPRLRPLALWFWIDSQDSISILRLTRPQLSTTLLPVYHCQQVPYSTTGHAATEKGKMSVAPYYYQHQLAARSSIVNGATVLQTKPFTSDDADQERKYKLQVALPSTYYLLGMLRHGHNNIIRFPTGNGRVSRWRVFDVFDGVVQGRQSTNAHEP
jgi:hypothetical protein